MGAERIVTEGRSWFEDAARPDRLLRVTPHPEDGVVTLSLWDGPTCVATHRVARESVPDLVGCLAGALVAEPRRLTVVPDPLPEPARPTAVTVAERWWRRVSSLADRGMPRRRS